MIDPKAIVSYAQFNEDTILKAFFYDVKKGFYIDVGANHPTIDSVTRTFYDKGWSGVNIEPVQSLYNQLVKDRPRDINLNCGIGATESTQQIREYVEMSGHSTFDETQKAAHPDSVKSKDYDVRVITLTNLFKETIKDKQVHFIKIDVEGYEYNVISGNNWAKYRPEVICIEANHVSEDWRPMLKKHKYSLVIADGLNEYYIANEAKYRLDGLAERMVASCYHTLKQHQWQSWSEDSRLLVDLTMKLDVQDKTLKNIVSRLEATARLSMHNRSFLGRLRVAIQGLTIDWLRNKPKK